MDKPCGVPSHEGVREVGLEVEFLNCPADWQEKAGGHPPKVHHEVTHLSRDRCCVCLKSRYVCASACVTFFFSEMAKQIFVKLSDVHQCVSESILGKKKPKGFVFWMYSIYYRRPVYPNRCTAPGTVK